MDIEKHIEGAIFGYLVADALGYPYKEQNINITGCASMHPSENFPAGTYTDAGSMMLSSIASINEWGEINYPDLMEKLRDWYLAGFMSSPNKSINNEDFSDAKLNVTQSIRNFDNGMPTDKCAMIDEYSFNNAALLRMLPISMILSSTQIDKAVPIIHLSTRITNHVPIAEVTSSVYCLIIANMIQGRAEKVFSVLNKFYTDSGMLAHFDALVDLQNWTKDNDVSGTDNVCDCFWTAWKSYSENQSDFELAVTNAIRYRNSTNEVAAITGSLAGLSLGINSIPTVFMQMVKIDDTAKNEISKFVKTVVRMIG